MSSELALAIESLADAIGDAPNNADLRMIRDQLDSWIMRENVRTALLGINAPDQIATIKDRLRRLQRTTEEYLAQKQNQRESLRLLGLGGGAGLTGGAIVTAMTLVAPIIAMIPAATGIFIMWRTETTSRNFTGEIELLRQIAEIARELAER